jgi:hypothetical protein
VSGRIFQTVSLDTPLNKGKENRLGHKPRYTGVPRGLRRAAAANAGSLPRGVLGGWAALPQAFVSVRTAYATCLASALLLRAWVP